MAMQERAVRTRGTVLRAAGEAFAAKGYPGTSMTDILVLAGVTKGALYFHFSSKEELAAAVVGEQQAAVQRVTEEVLAQQRTPLTTLVELSYRWAEQIQQDAAVRGGIRLTIEQGTFEQPMPELYLQWIELTSQLLTQARDAGEISADADPTAAAELVVGAFTGSQIVSQVFTGHADLIRRIDTLWSVFLNGLLPEGRTVMMLPRGAR